MKIEEFIEGFKAVHSLNDADSFELVMDFFHELKRSYEGGEKTAVVIAYYLFDKIANEKIRKRKVSARDFEDFLALSFKGRIMDTESRKNLPVSVANIDDKVVLTYISSNRREKMDILMTGDYGVSVKTSLPTNKEINMGSFAREALFKDFLTKEEYGGERKSGLGSKPQIKNVFKKIADKGLWKEFEKRFKLMLDNIYVDDLIICIKGGTYMEICFIKGSAFRKALLESIARGPDHVVDIINRYEGNSLRVERDKVMSLGKSIKIDFSLLETSGMAKIMDLVNNIEDSILKIFCGSKSVNKERVLTELNQLIEKL